MAVIVLQQAGTWLLTTLQRVKQDMGIAASETDDDDVLLGMIDRASSAIARETRRTFGLEVVAETLDGTGSRLLGLSRTPIVEITEITEDGSVLDPAEYAVEDADAGAVHRQAGWGRSGGLRMWGTEAYSSGYILPGYRDQRYSVTYRAGYVLPPEQNVYLLNGTDDPQNLPGAVEQACVETVKAWFFARDTDPALSSVQVGQLRVAYQQGGSQQPMGSLPASALGLLANYYAGPSR